MCIAGDSLDLSAVRVDDGNIGAGAAIHNEREATAETQHDGPRVAPGTNGRAQASARPTESLIRARGLTKRFGEFTAVDGKWAPRPLEDEANVDKRRELVGLQPLAEYAKELEKVYGAPK